MSAPDDQILGDGKRSPPSEGHDVGNHHADGHHHVESALRGRLPFSGKGATLEDYLYFADQQYHANDEHPLQSLRHDGQHHGLGSAIKDGLDFDPAHHSHLELIGAPPGPAIRQSPLRYLWGPSSPLLQVFKSVEEIHEKAEPTVTEKATVTDAEELSPDDDRDKDAIDRLILRQVTWLRCIYLITADVLGPYQGPYVYSQVGYVPGTIVFVVMGVMAYLAGVLMNILYLRVDSDRMPARSFGAIAQRVWGIYGRIICDFLMIVQLIFSCGLLTLTNAQSLNLIIDGSSTKPDGTPRHHLCFTVMMVVFMVISLLFSSIRSLKNVSYLGRISLALSVCAVIIATVFIYISPPNYAQAAQAGLSGAAAHAPVSATAFIANPLTAKVNGIMNMVYAFGGAMVFPNFYAEMRRPWDFYKSYFCAQVIIMFFYILIGILIYARQGQYTQSLFYFGVSKYSYQTVGNAIGVYTGLVGALLYGNIVQKEVYHRVVRGIFKGPALMSLKGYPFWMLGNMFIWPIAFVIGAAIPQVNSVSGIIGAVAILQFSYSFPFLLKFSFDVQVDAMKGDRPYVPGQAFGKYDHRVDSWLTLSRWRRGLFTGNVWSKLFFLTIGLAALAMSGLGIYGSSEAIIDAFAVPGAATSFGCITP